MVRTARQRKGKPGVVKARPRNYVLRHGTHEVYLLSIHDEKSLLTRLNSSLHVGDNFHMMAFQRNDILYPYGGCSFWNSRDFSYTTGPQEVTGSS